LQTFVYVVAGWFLFNIAFAAGMYFRPVRKRPGSPDGGVEKSSRDAGVEAPGLTPVRLRQPSNTLTGQYVSPQPRGAAKLLLFGFWVGDRLRSPGMAERKPL
jgi:hypothetical protein